MKKLFFIAFLFNSIMVMAQGSSSDLKTSNNIVTPVSDAACVALKKLVTLAVGDDLYGLAGDTFESKYMKPLFGAELFKASTNVPNVVESFVTLDRDEGAKYNAYLKDYGTNAAAAKADFKKVVATYSACFPNGKLTNSDAETAYIRVPKCKIKLHVYECSFTKTWAVYLTVEHGN